MEQSRWDELMLPHNVESGAARLREAYLPDPFYEAQEAKYGMDFWRGFYRQTPGLLGPPEFDTYPT